MSDPSRTAEFAWSCGSTESGEGPGSLSDAIERLLADRSGSAVPRITLTSDHPVLELVLEGALFGRMLSKFGSFDFDALVWAEAGEERPTTVTFDSLPSGTHTVSGDRGAISTAIQPHIEQHRLHEGRPSELRIQVVSLHGQCGLRLDESALRALSDFQTVVLVASSEPRPPDP